MQIRLASVMVDNQENALRFYTTILGFVKNKDIPMGPFRWLIVSSPEGAEGVELVLEPLRFAPAQTYQKALFGAGIPATAFITNDIDSEYRRLKTLGVRFHGEPKSKGPSPQYCLRITAATSLTWFNRRPNATLDSAKVCPCSSLAPYDADAGGLAACSNT